MKTFRQILVLVSLVLCMGFSICPGADPVAGTKTKVLVVTGGHGFDKEPFFKMFQNNTSITFTAAEHGKTNATAYERDDFLSYDAIVLYDMPGKVTDAQKKNFLALFDKGIGLVVLHHALCSFPDWPEYEKLIGGKYPTAGEGSDKVGYQHDVDIPVVVVAKDHPVTAGVKDFTLHDEIYWGFRVQPNVTTLLTTTYPKSGKPLAWAKTQGKSRVVFIQLGHGPQAFSDENYCRLVAQSIRWTANK